MALPKEQSDGNVRGRAEVWAGGTQKPPAFGSHWKCGRGEIMLGKCVVVGEEGQGRPPTGKRAARPPRPDLHSAQPRLQHESLGGQLPVETPPAPAEQTRQGGGLAWGSALHTLTCRGWPPCAPTAATGYPAEWRAGSSCR